MLLVEDAWTGFVKTRDPSQRDKLIMQYAPLVRYVIQRLAISYPTIVSSDDVYNCGIIGLIQAVDRFDPNREVKFETYAIRRIRGSIVDELRNLDPVPRSTRRKGREIERANAELQERLGRPATDIELAEYLGIELEALSSLLTQLSSLTVSLDAAIEADDGENSVSLAELVADESNPSPTESLERQELAQELAYFLGQLPPREKLVLALYYYEELTLREISEVLGISESRVCQLHTKAILRIRALFGSNIQAVRPTDKVCLTAVRGEDN